MPRIPLVEPEGAPPEIARLYEEFQGWGFPLFNVTKMFANHAGGMQAFMAMVRALYHQGKLSPRYRELAYLRASQVNACHY